MIFNSKKETVDYINKLLDSFVDVDYYRLKFILDRNNISVENLIFQELSDKSELSLISINLNSNLSVNLSINSLSWTKYLPSIYQDNDFLKNFLFGIQVTSLNQEEVIDNISDLFKPETTEFIDWLSSWFGIKYHTIVSEEAKKVMLYNMIELYKCRGTKKYFKRLVKILTNMDIEIVEYTVYSDYQHLSSQAFKNSFKVIIQQKISEDPIEEKTKLNIITNIINQEKPINTKANIEYSFIETVDYEAEKESIVDYHSEYQSDVTYDKESNNDYDY